MRVGPSLVQKIKGTNARSVPPGLAVEKRHSGGGSSCSSVWEYSSWGIYAPRAAGGGEGGPGTQVSCLQSFN